MEKDIVHVGVVSGVPRRDVLRETAFENAGKHPREIFAGGNVPILQRLVEDQSVLEHGGHSFDVSDVPPGNSRDKTFRMFKHTVHVRRRRDVPVVQVRAFKRVSVFKHLLERSDGTHVPIAEHTVERFHLIAANAWRVVE